MIQIPYSNNSTSRILPNLKHNNSLWIEIFKIKIVLCINKIKYRIFKIKSYKCINKYLDTISNNYKSHFRGIRINRILVIINLAKYNKTNKIARIANLTIIIKEMVKNILTNKKSNW